MSQLLSPRAMLCLDPLSWPTLCSPLDCSPPGSSVHGDSPGKNIGMGCSALLQGMFPTQGLNPGLLHCRQICYCLSHLGSPWATTTETGSPRARAPQETPPQWETHTQQLGKAHSDKGPAQPKINLKHELSRGTFNRIYLRPAHWKLSNFREKLTKTSLKK